MMTRRLISAENNITIAEGLMNNLKVNQVLRPDIPLIEYYILEQRLLLQKGYVEMAYGKNQSAATLFSSIIVSRPLTSSQLGIVTTLILENKLWKILS